MARLACLAISFFLHAGLVVWLAAGPGLFAPSPDAGPLEPEAVRVEMAPLPEASEGGLPEVTADAPPEAGADQGPATGETASGPPQARPGAGPDAAGAPEAPPPGVEVISPVKRNLNLPPPVHLGQGQIKTGKVTAMTLRRMAGYDFGLDEFCGHYEINGEPGRFVSVMDGRAAFGGLLMRDSATGMVRLMTRFSKFIFTYGPSFSQAEPAAGSITFLARKEFERIPDVDERSRILWQADAPPARIGVRLDFVERAVTLKAAGSGGTVRGLFVARADGGPYPAAVVSFGDDCRGWEEFPWLARAAAAGGLSLLGLEPPGCGGRVDKRSRASRRDAGREALTAALGMFSGASGADRPWAGAPAGLWGLGTGAFEALEAAGKGRPAFVVLAPDALGMGGLPPPGTGSSARLPGSGVAVLMVFFSAEAARDWEGVATGLRGAGAGVTVAVAPRSGGGEADEPFEGVARRLFAVLDAALSWARDQAR